MLPHVAILRNIPDNRMENAMVHRYIIPSVPLLFCLFFAAICIAAATEEAPQEPIIISVPAGAKLKKDKVAFPHKAHSALQCKECHHKLDEKPAVYSCTATGCHDLGNPTTSEERKSMAYFRNAFHKNSNASCNGCHKKLKKEGKPAGPTSCKKCHSTK